MDYKKFASLIRYSLHLVCYNFFMKKIYLIPIFPITIFATTLKVATYNVDNLFDLVNNGSEYAEYTPNKHNWNRIALTKKLQHISRVICDLNADILGLEEIENRNALTQLQNYLERRGCKYPYAAITNKSKSSIQVALLSKVRFRKKRDLVVSHSSADRNILEVTLETNPPLTIFVNHWRSKKASESARVKSAKVLMSRIEKMSKGSEYIILGDFNSDYDECINISAKNNDTNGTCGIDTVLKTYYNGKMIKLRDKTLPKNTIFHYNLWSEIDPNRRWSHDFYGQKSALDSIIIPPSLLDDKGWFYKRGSFGVFRKRYLFKKSKKGALYRWEIKHGKHTGYGYSDHLPLYATFTTTQKRELKHETLLDQFWKLFVPKIKEQKQQSISSNELTLNEFVKIKYIKSPVLLKGLCVVFKRGDIGVVKSSIDSPAITLYRSADGLEEGRCYDLKVYKKKRYYRIEEITDLDIEKEGERIDIKKFIPRFSHSLMQDDSNIGEIVRDIRGVYKDRYITVEGKKYRLYLKKRERGLLTKGSHLYIKKAQIGYYKGEKELIIYSLKDIIKEE